MLTLKRPADIQSDPIRLDAEYRSAPPKPTDKQALHKADGRLEEIVSFDCGCLARVGQQCCHWSRCELHRDQVILAPLPDGGMRLVAKDRNIDKLQDGSIRIVEVIRPLRKARIRPSLSKA